MRVLVIHPRMTVFGGGERVAVNSIVTALNGGHDVLLLSEEFDITAFGPGLGSIRKRLRASALVFAELI